MNSEECFKKRPFSGASNWLASGTGVVTLVYPEIDHRQALKTKQLLR